MIAIVGWIVILFNLDAVGLASGAHLHHVVVGKADIDKLVALEAHLQLSQILACAVVQFKASARAATIIIIIFLIIILSNYIIIYHLFFIVVGGKITKIFWEWIGSIWFNFIFECKKSLKGNGVGKIIAITSTISIVMATGFYLPLRQKIISLKGKFSCGFGCMLSKPPV